MNLRFIVKLETIRTRNSQRGPQYRVTMNDGMVYHTEPGNSVAYEIVIPSVSRLPVELQLNRKGEITGIEIEQLPEGMLQWRQIRPEDISPDTKLEIADDGEYVYLRNGAGDTHTDPMIVMPPGDFAGKTVGQSVGRNVGQSVGEEVGIYPETGSGETPEMRSCYRPWPEIRAQGRQIRNKAALELDSDCLPWDYTTEDMSAPGAHTMGVPGCKECAEYDAKHPRR